MRKLLVLIAALALSCQASMAQAKSWVLVPDQSKIAFGSIKKNTTGETHHFAVLAGSAGANGKASVTIDLNSVETWIDIRNDRIRKHVFADAPAATVSTMIDMAALETMAVGDTKAMDIKANLEFLGQSVAVEAPVFMVRLSENRVMVSTDEIIMLSTADLGIDAGVDMLMKLAKLPAITRVTPVTFRFVFER